MSQTIFDNMIHRPMPNIQDQACILKTYRIPWNHPSTYPNLIHKFLGTRNTLRGGAVIILRIFTVNCFNFKLSKCPWERLLPQHYDKSHNAEVAVGVRDVPAMERERGCVLEQFQLRFNHALLQNFTSKLGILTESRCCVGP